MEAFNSMTMAAGSFRAGMQVGMRIGGGGEEARTLAALSLASPFLSNIEQRSLMHLGRALTRDGDLSHRDAQTLMHMAKAYVFDGTAALQPFWPFADLNLARSPGNPLFDAMASYIGQQIGESLQDLAFLQAADSLLDSVPGSLASGALSAAFAAADLSKLSAGERTQLLSSLAIAGSNGHIGWAEASAIIAQLALFTGTPPPAPPVPETNNGAWTSTPTGDGRMQIDLGNYTLDLNEHNSEMVLTNKQTGESSKIWGDPHFDTDNDGQTDVDFWGTMTLNLEDGTRITINTTPFDANKEMTLSSQLIIVKGDQAMVVKGLDQNQIGDMTVTQSQNGRLLDTAYGKGLNVYENANGKGWQVRDGLWMRDLTQADADSTKAKPGSEFRADLLAAMFTFRGLMASSMLMGMMFSAEGVRAGWSK